jgi:Arc/MetJ-type ribon-helix-helix transcriptional regulator
VSEAAATAGIECRSERLPGVDIVVLGSSYMEPVTVSIEESHTDLLDELSTEGGPCTNRSEAMRMIIDQYTEQNELAQEVERLTRERRQLLEQREEHDELVRYVADELSYREQGLLTRARWWLFGKD